MNRKTAEIPAVFVFLYVKPNAYFRKSFMKKILFISAISVLSCAKQQSHPPVGGFLSEKDLQASKNRAKVLNETERVQIQEWIKAQDEKFYPMSMNYWVNLENLGANTRKSNDEIVSYQFDIYDFDGVKLYDKPKKNENVQLGRFEELEAVEDAVRYLNSNQEVTLLVPSVLAFGTYGDNDKIPNDMPLIIKLKAL